MKKSGLNIDNLLDQLEELAASLDIKVRYEQIKKEGAFYPGGLCKVKGEVILIINSNASKEDKIETLAKAVNSFDISNVYMRPALRDFLLEFSAE